MDQEALGFSLGSHWFSDFLSSGWQQDPSLGTTQLPEATLSRCLGVHTQFENTVSGEHVSEQNREDSLLSSLESESKLVLESEKQPLPPEAREMVQ